ncbi:MAG: hypothetical protein AAGD25_11725 [Cyanobacteria bacterium P01_F01_bin.150]
MTGQDAIVLMMDYETIWDDRFPRWLARYWMIWHIYSKSIFKLGRF